MNEFGQAFGYLTPDQDFSTPNPWRALLADPDAQFIHLIELHPYDDGLPGTTSAPLPFASASFGHFSISFGGGVNRVYLSDMGFTTRPDDTEPNRHYKALVNNPMQFETSILSGAEFGNGAISFGAIVIENGDGDLDELTDFHWHGRRVVIKAGTKTLPYSQFATILDGAVEDFEETDTQITLTIRDNRIRADQFLSAPTYEGTGGTEGSADLAGYNKPLCFGEVKNIEPPLVDEALTIYQIHDGTILAVDTVRDSGVPLTFDADYPDIALAAPGAGEYATQLSGGFIRLGSTPAGRVTVDVKGANDGGYVSTAGAIAKRILTERLASPFAPSQLDDGALARIDGAIPGDMGVYIGDQVSASAVIDELLLPCAAYWTFGRLGILTGGLITVPGVPTIELDTDDIDQEGVQIVTTIPPAWRISVGYAPLGVVQGEAELAGDPTVDRAFLTSPYRYVTQENATIRASNDLAMDRTFQTRLVDQADAETLLERLAAVFMQRRRVYRVPIRNALYRINVGDTVRVTYPRHGLASGKALIVVGISENAETGQTVLEVWG